jgi:hypothetical protein
MSRQFTKLSNTARYNIGQQTKIFLSEPYRYGKSPVFETLVLDAPIVFGDETITLSTPSAKTLHEGTRLNFGTEDDPATVIVAGLADPGDTVININKSTCDAPDNATAILDTPYPLFSAKVFETDNSPTMFNDQNFSAMYYTAGAIPGIEAKGSSSGAWIKDDPGHAIVQRAIKIGYLCKIQVLDPFGRGGQYASVFFGSNKTRTQNQFTQVAYNIIVTGSWKTYKPNPLQDI